LNKRKAHDITCGPTGLRDGSGHLRDSGSGETREGLMVPSQLDPSFGACTSPASCPDTARSFLHGCVAESNGSAQLTTGARHNCAQYDEASCGAIPGTPRRLRIGLEDLPHDLFDNPRPDWFPRLIGRRSNRDDYHCWRGSKRSRCLLTPKWGMGTCAPARPYPHVYDAQRVSRCEVL